MLNTQEQKNKNIILINMILRLKKGTIHMIGGFYSFSDILLRRLYYSAQNYSRHDRKQNSNISRECQTGCCVEEGSFAITLNKSEICADADNECRYSEVPIPTRLVL